MAFINPRAIRYRSGKASPDGFYLDSYDYDALREQLLDPLGPTGTGRYRLKVFDHIEDRPIAAPVLKAAPGSVLLLDGIFLHRPELCGFWDMSFFLIVPFEISVPRGAARGEGFGSPDPNAPSNRRYIAGQRRYLNDCSPESRATVAIDNTDLDALVIVESQ
jgi:uridine kinase